MRAAVFYATRDGHTRRIAQRIAGGLYAGRVDTDLYDIRALPASAQVQWDRYTIVCLAASVRVGRHERAMVRFVRRHRQQLDRLGAVFVSVSLSQAGAQDRRATADARARCAADVARMVDTFVAETGWRPTRWQPVAGAITYTRYNVLLRYFMKRIARSQGGPTDTSRDHDMTDWPAVDRFAADLAAGVL